MCTYGLFLPPSLKNIQILEPLLDTMVSFSSAHTTALITVNSCRYVTSVSVPSFIVDSVFLPALSLSRRHLFVWVFDFGFPQAMAWHVTRPFQLFRQLCQERYGSVTTISHDRLKQMMDGEHLLALHERGGEYEVLVLRDLLVCV